MAPANIAPQAPRTMKARIHTTMLATAAPQNPKKTDFECSAGRHNHLLLWCCKNRRQRYPGLAVPSVAAIW